MHFFFCIQLFQHHCWKDFLHNCELYCLWSFVNLTLFGCCAKSFQLCPACCDPMDWVHQAPLSMGFSRQEYWSGLPCSPPGNLPDWAFVSYGSWIGRRVLYHQGHLGSPCLYLGECILGFSMLCHQPICLFFQWNATVLVTVLKYYKWFSVSPKVGLCQSSDFVFFLQCCVGYCGFLPLCKILESVCRYPPNNLQGLVLFWIWRSHWKELTSCQ